VERYIQKSDWHSSLFEKLLCIALVRSDIYKFIYKLRESPIINDGLLDSKCIEQIQKELTGLELELKWVFRKEHKIGKLRRMLYLLQNIDSYNRMARITGWLGHNWIQPDRILRAIELDYEQIGIEYNDSLYNLLHHVLKLGHRWYP